MNRTIWSGNAFEFFIISVLRQIASVYNQEIIFDTIPPLDLISANSNVHDSFDAIAPNGFEKHEGVVIFEFKSYSSSTKDDKNRILSALNGFAKTIKQMQISADVTGILITNLPVSQYFDDFNNLNKHLDNVNLKIWDQEVINNWIEEYPIDYSNALSLLPQSNSKNIKTLAENITTNDFDEKSTNNIAAIKSIIESEDNFAFVLGAGISIDPGAQSWNSLLEQFADELHSKGIIDDSKKLSGKIGGSSLITAQMCKELYPNDSDYFWAIHQGLYADRKDISENFALYHIAKIASNCIEKSHFRILTYNYDNYLESYLEYFHIQYNSLYDSKCDINSKLSLYHVHGYLPQVKYKSYIQDRYKKSIYLTEENYNDLYNHPYSWQISSQLSFFRENICLFVGCSLADPNIRRLLEMTKKENRTHYAILTKDKMSTKDLIIASNHFARLGIEVIWVKDYSEISSKLRLLY